jgi:hypothetical protein
LFTSGTNVTLAAKPALGKFFTGWSGACSGTGACLVTMNSSMNVNAKFTQIPLAYTLQVWSTGDGAITNEGKVTSVPAGINCSTADRSCTASYPPGTMITLTATPSSPNTIFSGWNQYNSQQCRHAGSKPCTVILTGDDFEQAMFKYVF